MVAIRKEKREPRPINNFSHGVTLTEHIELPIGITVGIWTFEAGGQLRYNPNHRDYAEMGLTVLSGSGRVEVEDEEPEQVAAGNFIFVRSAESLNLTAEDGLVLLAVGGGWEYPG